MNDRTFKHKLFFEVLGRERQAPFGDVVGKTKYLHNLLHGMEPELEDIRVNTEERPPVTLDEAVEKLAFDLQHREEFREGYKTNIALVIMRFLEVEGYGKKAQSHAKERCKEIADSIIDEFIFNVQATKEYEEPKCCRED